MGHIKETELIVQSMDVKIIKEGLWLIANFENDDNCHEVNYANGSHAIIRDWTRATEIIKRKVRCARRK